MARSRGQPGVAVADVFISYKAEDRARLAPLVAALEGGGLSVWWDADIAGGDHWRETIERELDSATCVIVAWSKRSVGPEGRFVRDEASRAQRRGAYLPIRLDRVEPPLGFGEIQAMSLIGWDGSPHDPLFQALDQSVRARLGAPAFVHRAVASAVTTHRRTVIIGGALAGVAAAGVGAWHYWPHKGAHPGDGGVVVLPFTNLTGDGAKAYIADGITDEIRGALAMVSGLRVIGQRSSQAARELSPADIVAKLGVANILSGSVRQSATSIRVIAELSDSTTGERRWAATYDRSVADIIPVEADIARNVASRLSTQITAPGQSIGTANVEAHDLYLQARALSDDWTAVNRVLALADAAIRLDPKYAKAHALRARYLIYKASNATSPEAILSWRSEAGKAARLCLSIDPANASAYSTLGLVEQFGLNMRKAVDYFARGRSLSPNGKTDSDFVLTLAQLGRTGEAILASDANISLDPLNPGAFATKAEALYCQRNYTQAVDIAQQTLGWAQRSLGMRATLGYSLLMLGKYRDALTAFAALPSGNVACLTGTALACDKLGDRKAADTALAEMKQAYGDTINYQIAQIEAQRGHIEPTLTALEAAHRFLDAGLIALRTDPFLDPVRDQPRFRALLAALDLP